MRSFKHLLLLVLFVSTTAIFAQSKLTGTIVDQSGVPVTGANVIIKSQNKGTNTDFDGNFSVNVEAGSGVLEIIFMGYTTLKLNYTVADGATKNFGTITLQEDANALDEIVISGIIDLAKDRKTPVAVSTIRIDEIQAKLGSLEFPELLKSTPSVYVTKQGGGFGDARINIRGFSQENVAVMINGMPVNDMESGAVYWSNWSGLSDVTSAMQVQRGLGSSKLAISSVGGTINVVLKSSDKKEGGSVSVGMGNDMYMKTLASYNTGLMDSGFSTSVLMSRTSGDGYAQGTAFTGYSYFIGMGYKASEKHDFQFILTGAPQEHARRAYTTSIDKYLKYGTKYNENYGTLKGKDFNWGNNNYHKPVASLNWEWKINDTSKLSTIVYASYGRGGGTSGNGKINGKKSYKDFFKNPDTGNIDFDKIYAYNSGEPVTFYDGDTDVHTATPNADGKYISGSSEGIILYNSINSHNWIGSVINFNEKINENLTLDLGIDLRDYTGIHYKEVANLLGSDGYSDGTDLNNPNTINIVEHDYDLASTLNVFKSITEGDKIRHNYEGKVKWSGLFAQLEYSKEDVSVFVQAAVSSQTFQRIDKMRYLNSDPNRKSKKETIVGGNVKGGINYNIDEQHNIFANAGYYSKQPNFFAIFTESKYGTNGNTINEDYKNEQITGIELGYGFRSSNFSANVNIYRTTWNDIFKRNRDAVTQDDITLSGLKEIHQGVEVDFTYKILDNLSVVGVLSIGDWFYEGNPVGKAYEENTGVLLNEQVLYMDDVKVGDSAQLTSRLGLNYEAIEGLNFDVSWDYVDKLYAKLNISNFSSEDHKGSLKLPSYNLMDAGVSYKWNLKAGKSLNFRLNINNLFDEVYISESTSNTFDGDYGSTGVKYKGIDTGNKVFFGFGRTWNTSVRFNF